MICTTNRAQLKSSVKASLVVPRRTGSDVGYGVCTMKQYTPKPESATEELAHNGVGIFPSPFLLRVPVGLDTSKATLSTMLQTAPVSREDPLWLQQCAPIALNLHVSRHSWMLLTRGPTVQVSPRKRPFWPIPNTICPIFGLVPDKSDR